MSALPNWSTIWGVDLTPADYEGLAKRWITKEGADEAGICRVDSITGQQMFGRKRGNCAGIIIPNCPPWNPDEVREFRLRLDNPELERHSDGSIRESKKYLQPPQRPNIAYFPPSLPAEALSDAHLKVIITEGEFKAIALQRLARYKSETLRFLTIAFSGVHNFRGTVGKAVGPTATARM